MSDKNVEKNFASQKKCSIEKTNEFIETNQLCILLHKKDNETNAKKKKKKT